MSYFILFLIACGCAFIAGSLCALLKIKSTLCTILTVGVFASATALLLLFNSTKHTQSTSVADTIIVGTSGDFPPFSFFKNEKLVGFDIDLIDEIGKRLHKKIELKNMPFGSLLPSLQTGNMQMIASGLTATSERAKHVLFTTPYLENNQFVIVSLNTAPANSVTDLTNKEVIVNEGYTADLYLSTLSGPIIIRLKTPAEAFLALKSGRAFAFVTAQNTVKPFFDQYGAQDFHVVPIAGTEENASVAVAPQYPELLTQVQKALENMKEDGFLDKLRTQWGL
jgi:polar amino acid transport system substrate-binding protein